MRAGPVPMKERVTMRLAQRSARVLLATAMLVLAVAAAPASSRAASKPAIGHLVLAHYMVCCGRFGHEATAEQYQQEFDAARRLKIDGFVLNIIGWTPGSVYPKVTRAIFDAAAKSGPDFKLMISLDKATIMPEDDAAAMVAEFASHPNYLKIDGRPVVSTFHGTKEWGEGVVRRLHDKGIDIFFMPFFNYSVRDMQARMDPRGVAIYAAERALADNPAIDGYFMFGAAGTGPELTRQIRGITELATRYGKASMMGIGPFYRGVENNSRVFESNGFESMQMQWRAAIESGTDWVQIVTWNDWGESSYVAPFGGPRDQGLWNGHWNKLLAHDAFMKASAYYVDWFKTRQPPRIERDALFYFYRPHLKAAEAFVARDGKGRGRPKGWEALNDDVFLTGFMSRPARVTVRVGETTQVLDLPAGVSSHRVPAVLGDVEIAVEREGAQKVVKSLEFPISADGTVGNFNYFAGEVPLL